LLGSIGVAHHPIFHRADAASAGTFAQISTLNTVVHAALIMVMLVIALCMAQYSAMRQQQRAQGDLVNPSSALTRSAMLLFGFGTLALCFAGLINGFIAPDLMNASASDMANPAYAHPAQPLLLRACWVANQRLMALGGFSFAAAVALWAWDLLRHTPQHRSLGWLGLALALAEVLWQLAQSSKFDVRNLQLFWLWFCVWCGISAWVMLRAPHATETAVADG
jgi:hypothetical protein